MKTRLVMILMLVAGLLVSCQISKPVLPEWDVTLNIPLINRSFFVSDLVDSVNVITDNNDVLTITGSGGMQSAPFGMVRFSTNLTTSAIPLVSGINVVLRVPMVDSGNITDISYGEIASGAIRSLFTDIAPEVTLMELCIEELKQPNGESFRVTYQGETGWQDHLLGGFHIGTLDTGVLVDTLHINVQVQSTLPDNTPIGKINLSITEPIYFEVFQGHLAEQTVWLEEDETSINIDYPFGIEEAIHLQQARLMINITNELGFHCTFHGSLQAENTRTGQKVSTPILDDNDNLYTISPASLTEPSYTELIFEDNISELLQIMPDKVSLENAFFTLCCGTVDEIGSVRSTDIIEVHYQVDAPFIFEVTEATVAPDDAVELEIPEDARDLIRTNARNAELSMMIRNKIPLGFNANLYIGETEDMDYTDSSTYLLRKNLSLRSSQWVEANPTHPEVTADGYQLFTLNLSREEMEIFTNPKLYLLWTFNFDGSGVVTVTASPADYIHIKGMLKLNVRIKEDE